MTLSLISCILQPLIHISSFTATPVSHIPAQPSQTIPSFSNHHRSSAFQPHLFNTSIHTPLSISTLHKHKFHSYLYVIKVNYPIPLIMPNHSVRLPTANVMIIRSKIYIKIIQETQDGKTSESYSTLCYSKLCYLLHHYKIKQISSYQPVSNVSVSVSV